MIVRTLVFAFLAIVASALPVSADDTCPTTQTSGSGEKLFTTCITETGNVEKFITPAGVDNLVIDSYIICDAESGGPGQARAYSRGSPFLESNFAFPTSHSASKNVRTTDDGRYSLTQSYVRDILERQLIITMTLRNNGPGPVTDVQLLRVADIHAGESFANFVFVSKDSVAAVGSGARGMMMGVLTPEIQHLAYANTFSQFVADRYRDCLVQTAGTQITGEGDLVLLLGDYVGAIQFYLGTIGAGAAKTVKLFYQRF
jgi:hypothetical protein